jgi:hypothetical protein
LNVDKADDAPKWFSEESLKAAAMAHLVEDGWSIRWVAEPRLEGPGTPTPEELRARPAPDIEAERDEVRILVQVIEYPDGDRWLARHPERVGEIKVLDSGEVQGKSGRWGISSYSHALIFPVHQRLKDPDARIVQLYPLIGIYRTLEDPYAHRPEQSLHAYESKYLRDRRIELWLLRENGTLFVKSTD